jgi:hypothetical protein
LIFRHNIHAETYLVIVHIFTWDFQLESGFRSN